MKKRTAATLRGDGITAQIALLIWALLQLFPVYWLIILSFKSTQEIFSGNSLGFPNEWLLSNYDFIFRNGNMGTYLFNSVVVTAATIVLVSVTSIMAAFGITRLRWKWSSGAESAFILGVTIPIHAVLLPIFMFLKNIHLLDTHLALILPYTAFSMPMAILICNGLMRSIPTEIDEAALLDGCNLRQLFFRIIFPMMRPGIATISIFTFLHSWNELLFAQIFVDDKRIKTLTAGIQSLVGEFSTDWGSVCAALTVAALPTIIAYLFLSKRVQESMITGSIKM